MGILDSFRKQKEIDKLSENYYTEGVENMTPEQLEEYKKTVDEMREKMESPVHTDGTKIVNKSYPNFDSNVSHEEYEKILDEDLSTEDLVLSELYNIHKLVLRSIFCPECGSKMESTLPTTYNPFSGESYSKTTCENCGKTYMLEHSYPRLMILDNENKETKFFV